MSDVAFLILIFQFINAIVFSISISVSVERCLRKKHSKTFIKKTNKNYQFIRRFIYLQWRKELPLHLFVLGVCSNITLIFSLCISVIYFFRFVLGSNLYFADIVLTDIIVALIEFFWLIRIIFAIYKK